MEEHEGLNIAKLRSKNTAFNINWKNFKLPLLYVTSRVDNLRSRTLSSISRLREARRRKATSLASVTRILARRFLTVVREPSSKMLRNLHHVFNSIKEISQLREWLIFLSHLAWLFRYLLQNTSPASTNPFRTHVGRRREVSRSSACILAIDETGRIC